MIDVAEMVKNTNMFELAQKTNHTVDLTAAETEIAEELDAQFKEIGETGRDNDLVISQFLRKVINQEIYEAPDEILESMFEMDSIGEADDYSAVLMPPANTLVAYEAGKGGNVPKSFLDFSAVTPTWKNLQVESDISFADLRRNGWKTVSLIAENAVAALKNSRFAVVMAALDNAIVSGAPNYITEATTMPTATSMDALATYIAERQENGDAVILGLYKYILAASKLQSASDSMKDEMYRNGILSYYGGIPMKYVSSAKKVQGQLMLPDNRIFGVAGRIGTLTQKGDIRTYEVENPSREYVHLMWKDYTFGYAISPTALEKVAKIVLA